MALFGEGKAIVDLLAHWRKWRKDSNDPARQQAERLIAAFEAYGVRRQQIARLMPESVALPSPLMSRPSRSAPGAAGASPPGIGPASPLPRA